MIYEGRNYRNATLTLIQTICGENFAIVDAAMNDLIRPALYGSYHEIIPVNIDVSSFEFHADHPGWPHRP